MGRLVAGGAQPNAAAANGVESDPFRSLLPAMCVIGVTVHIAFLALFLVTRIDVMAVVNVVSTLWYAAMFLMVRRGRTNPVVELVLLAVEIVAHAVIATAVLGWSSGFHYYVLLLVPVTAVATIVPGWLKVAAVAVAGLAYLGLDLWLRAEPVPQPLPRGAVDYVHYFNVLLVLLVLAWIFGRYYLLIRNMQAALRGLAETDFLTQLPNRISLERSIAIQQAQASRGHPLSFIMCDIDHFKKINDEGGHSAGDDVLRAVSRSMDGSVRATDAVGRWGGEEFLVVLPDADAAEAAPVAERLRQDVAALHVLVADRPSRVTVTVGVATVGPNESAAEAIMRADRALYEGKRAGRNRVVVAADAAPAGSASTSR